MKILQSKKFKRKIAKLISSNSQLQEKLFDVYQMMAADLNNPKLKTHKLKGELEEYWACSLTYNIRIIFTFTTHEGEKIIELLTVGGHDEVY